MFWTLNELYKVITFNILSSVLLKQWLRDNSVNWSAAIVTSFLFHRSLCFSTWNSWTEVRYPTKKQSTVWLHKTPPKSGEVKSFTNTSTDVMRMKPKPWRLPSQPTGCAVDWGQWLTPAAPRTPNNGNIKDLTPQSKLWLCQASVTAVHRYLHPPTVTLPSWTPAKPPENFPRVYRSEPPPDAETFQSHIFHQEIASEVYAFICHPMKHSQIQSVNYGAINYYLQTSMKYVDS